MTGRIDVHAHFLTERYAAACRAAGHGQPDGMPAIPDWTVDGALAVMDEIGIDAQVLSVSSPGVHFGGADLAAHVNDEAAGIVAAHPDRFGFAASLPLPDVDAALVELARACDDLGADAVALETNHDGRYLGEFEPVLAALDARAAVVTLHPTSPACWEATALGRPRPMMEFLFDTTRCVADLILGGAMARYPYIRWIVPHAGAALPVLAHRLAAMSGMVGEPVDVPAALAGLYYDLAGFPVPVALDALLAVAGPDRLLYGSDYPFTPAPAVAQLAAALDGVPALDVVRDNAIRLFPRLRTARSARPAAW